MLLTSAILLSLFLAGGTNRIDGWFLSPLAPPALGLIFFVPLVIYAVVKPRFSRLLVITSLIALLSMAPAIRLVAPVA